MLKLCERHEPQRDELPLPDELLLQVSGYLSRADQLALCLTYREAHRVVGGDLYRHLKFTCSMGEKLQLLFRSLV
jgi:hypothetical protein